MSLRGVVLTFGLAAIFCLAFFTPASGAEGKKAEANSIDVLADLLKAKGVLSPEEAASLKGKPVGPETAESLKELVEILRSKGLVSDNEAAGINQAIAKPASSQAVPKSILVVPRDKEYVQKITENVTTAVKQDINQQVEAQIAERAKEGTLGDIAAKLPDWVYRIKFSGDMRLRYEPDFFDSNNGLVLDPQTTNSSGNVSFFNNSIDRERYRIRARLKMEAAVNDNVLAGVRLATGTDKNPVSTNTTLGDYYNKKGFLLDQAYLQITPINGLTIWGGRMPNPWFYSDLVWDSNLNFEGFAGTYQQNICDGLGAFLTVGAFPLQEVELSQHDKWLLGGQAGIDFKREKQFSAKVGVAFYDFEHTRGEQNAPDDTTLDFTAPLFMQKGNTVFDIHTPVVGATTPKFALAAQYRELDIIGRLDISFWDPIHVIFLGDYVRNISLDKDAVSAISNPFRPADEMQNDGYQIGMTVGYPTPRKFGQWNIFGYYKRIGTDAVVDAFTDSDFNLGGTNAKGFIVGGELGLYKNVWLTARWLSSDQISPFQGSTGPFSVDVFQLDTNAAF